MELIENRVRELMMAVTSLSKDSLNYKITVKTLIENIDYLRGLSPDSKLITEAQVFVSKFY